MAPPTAPHRGLAELLDHADGALDVARITCVHGPTLLGFARCAVVFAESTGVPLLSVDQDDKRSDDDRLAWLTDGWRHDAAYVALFRDERPLRHGSELLVPLVEPRGLLGALRCTSVSAELEINAAMLATHVSVKLASLGVSGFGSHAELTARQYAIAQQAATGATNAEIADAFGISINTVKVHLKDVFALLDVVNRTELANVLRRLPPPGMIRGGSVQAGIDGPHVVTVAHAGTRARTSSNALVDGDAVDHHR